MFPGMVCKIGFGMVLALLSHCAEGFAVTAPAERLREMLSGLARSEYSIVQRSCRAVELKAEDEIERAGVVRALKRGAEAVARRAERLAEAGKRIAERAAEFVTVKLPERVAAAWNELKTAVTGDERAVEGEI